MTNKNLQGKDIVVVEDDESFRSFLEDTLKNEGCKVRSFENPVQALKELSERSWNWTPWLVITDIVMPQLSGYQFMNRLKDLFKNRPLAILVISRLGGADDQSDAELAGATKYLRKPVKDAQMIIDAIWAAQDKAHAKIKKDLVTDI